MEMPFSLETPSRKRFAAAPVEHFYQIDSNDILTASEPEVSRLLFQQLYHHTHTRARAHTHARTRWALDARILERVELIFRNVSQGEDPRPVPHDHFADLAKQQDPVGRRNVEL